MDDLGGKLGVGFEYALVLDGAQAGGLGLPAAEGGAVVFEGEFEVAQWCWCLGGLIQGF